jgi:hypothetical protein
MEATKRILDYQGNEETDWSPEPTPVRYLPRLARGARGGDGWIRMEEACTARGGREGETQKPG